MTADLDFPAVDTWSWLASNAVACPKCKSHPGSPCYSTGGGNTAVVATHAARRARVAGWPTEFANRAGWTARRYQRRHDEDWPVGAFAEFEAAAAPIVEKPTKPVTPTGVRLSEAQAERIEASVESDRPGWFYSPTAHFHGCADIRKPLNALEGKGIAEFVADTADYYGRWLRLTPFGWQVYRQHRLIIRRFTGAEVDALEAGCEVPA